MSEHDEILQGLNRLIGENAKLIQERDALREEVKRLKKRAKEAERLLKLAKQNHLANHAFMAEEYGCEPIEKDNFTDAIDAYIKEVQP